MLSIETVWLMSLWCIIWRYCPRQRLSCLSPPTGPSALCLTHPLHPSNVDCFLTQTLKLSSVGVSNNLNICLLGLGCADSESGSLKSQSLLGCGVFVVRNLEHEANQSFLRPFLRVIKSLWTPEFKIVPRCSFWPLWYGPLWVSEWGRGQVTVSRCLRLACCTVDNFHSPDW